MVTCTRAFALLVFQSAALALLVACGNQRLVPADRPEPPDATTDPDTGKGPVPGDVPASQTVIPNRSMGLAGNVRVAAGAPGGAGYSNDPRALRLAFPHGILHNAHDNLVYVADTENHVLRIYDDAGRMRLVCGTPGVAGFQDGHCASARFNRPTGIRMSRDGRVMYVADTGNHAIRAIDVRAVQATTLAGDGTPGSKTGCVTSGGSFFDSPVALGYNPLDDRTLYVADRALNQVRSIDFGGPCPQVAVVAGSGEPGFADGPALQGKLLRPSGVAVPPVGPLAGKVLIGDTGNHVVRVLDPATGELSTLLGRPGEAGGADGPLGEARLREPTQIEAVHDRMYVADTGNHTVRAVDLAGGVVTTIAGKAGEPGSLDGTTEHRLRGPTGIATTGPFGSSVYVSDTGNHVVRLVVSSDGGWPFGPRQPGVRVVLGQPAAAAVVDGRAADARFAGPTGIALVGGAIHVADHDGHVLRRVDPATGEVTTVAGLGGQAGREDGVGTAARLERPTALASDGALLIFAEAGGAVRRFDPQTGSVTTLLASGLACAPEAPSEPRGLAATDLGLLVADAFGQVVRLIPAGGGAPVTIAGTCHERGPLGGPASVAATRDGRTLYVADRDAHAIRRLRRAPGGAYRVEMLAGKDGEPGFGDGPAAAARFDQPSALWLDGDTLLVGERGAIRAIALGDGSVTTVVGRPDVRAVLDGPFGTGALNRVGGLLRDPSSGWIWATDASENVVVRVE